MEPIQTGVGLISGGTGVSIQLIVAVVGGSLAFGIAALKWIDSRIAKAVEKLGSQILAIDERYRADQLRLEHRLTSLETSPFEWRQRQGHSVNGQ